MKRVLFVSNCEKRGNTTGLTGKALKAFEDIDSSSLELNLFDIGFFDVDHNPNDYPVNKYYALPKYPLETFVRSIPGLRAWYAEQVIVSTFRMIMKKNRFDYVLLYHIPAFANRIVDICHANNTICIFLPGGSDILRVGRRVKNRLMKAFSKVDFVVGGINSNTVLGAQSIYHVPENKIKTKKNYISGIRVLMGIDKSLSRCEMSKIVGIEESDYNIVCSYNAYPSHRHKQIIEAIAENRNVLPRNYQLVFPMTYGGSSSYVQEIRQMCTREGLRAVFLTSFLSPEQMAYLHLITDLFIEIQPTDAGNAFMMEALFAGNKIVTGRWLKYRQFEQFGVPYFLIEKQEDLSKMLYSIFEGQVTAKVPQELIDMFTIPSDYDKSKFWRNLFEIG